MRPVPVLLRAVAFVVLLAPGHVAARACGDVDDTGRKTPCACGDVLVGSTTLSADDPVTREPCEGDGLIVRIPPSLSGAVLDLGGRTISGRGRGIGLHVQGGGKDGLTITGPGVIREFDVGVLATGTVHLVTDVVCAAHRTDGFRLTGAGFTVSGCEARENGRTGFFLRGSDYHVSGNRALDNGRDGFSLAGRRAVIAGATQNESAGNVAHGMTVGGRGHVIKDVSATGNRGGGLRARVAATAMVGPRLHGNTGADLSVSGHDSSIDPGTDPSLARVRGKRLTVHAPDRGAAQ